MAVSSETRDDACAGRIVDGPSRDGPMPVHHRSGARSASGFDRRPGNGYTAAMLTLTPAESRALRARAHTLHPVVAIGHSGLTPAVLHEIDVALAAHELVKVRVHSDDREERERHLAAVCEGLGAAPVQHLGKLLIVWRPKPVRDEPAPRRAPKDPRKGKKGAHANRRPGQARIGERASAHRRGSSRHSPNAPFEGERAHPTRRRTARAAPAEPAVPTTSAPRGARFRHGKPVTPKGKRPAQGSAGKHSTQSQAPAGNRKAQGQWTERRSSAPAGKRAHASGASTAPAAVRRRRRPAGGRSRP